ncbi:transcriptional regulator [Reticulibacter mediterranei]|uniref:Transcriptional regulator n=1 Tax=Reticulibacter mediterranei TaxID=2778369 RepID=A0A8J3IWW2_9CHLR|nr:helix-turn-helix transcriptional regulator [Reticulibacter mediterranei]GHO99988.1 transcriptional regulator [Reticulibacter mediterranei]
MTKIEKRRIELGDFLKTRRARLRPEQFDLPVFSRRRTQGLRREELAQLVGVGVSWYTWLEQGRAIQVSDHLLSRLADILQLDWEERSHLFTLAQDPMSQPWKEGTEPQNNTAYQAILDGLGSYPTLLIDRRLNVVASNESASCVLGNFASDGERERNMVWSIFMNTTLQERLVHWERAARLSLAFLRAKSDQYAGEAWFTDLVNDLRQASPEFRSWWPEHDIRLACHDRYEIDHPLVGRLTFQATNLVEPSRPDLRLVVLTPLPQEDTAAKLGVLMTRGNPCKLSK